jgi:hypothetical protein
VKNLFKLLEDKNYWYQKYLLSNEAYLQALIHAPEVAIEELELFYGNRESLLKILEDLDQRVQETINAQGTHFEPNSADRTVIQRFIREKDSMIKRIVEIDEKILSLMEKIQADGLEKLKLLGKGKKALAKYKSSHNYSDKIDKRI